MIKTHNTLIRNFFSVGLVQLLNYLVPLLLFPYLVRVFGLKGFGKFTYAQSIGMYLDLIISYGFALTVPVLVAKNIKDKLYLNKLVSEIIIFKVVLFLILVILFLVAKFVLRFLIIDSLLVFAAFSVPFGNIFLLDWYYQGIQKMDFIVYSTIFSRIISLLLIIIFVRNEGDIYLCLFLLGFGGWIASIVSYLLAKYKFELCFTTVSIKSVKEHLISNFWPFASIITVPFYSTINIIILRYVAGDIAVGTYAIPEKIAGSLISLQAFFTKPLLPFLASIIKEDRRKYSDNVRKFGVLIFSIFSILAVLVYFLSYQIIILTNGDRNGGIESQVTIMKILCFAIAIAPLVIFFQQNLIILNKKKVIFYIVLTTAVLNLIIVYPIVNYWGGVGLSINYSIIIMFLVSISIYYYHKSQ